VELVAALVAGEAVVPVVVAVGVVVVGVLTAAVVAVPAAAVVAAPPAGCSVTNCVKALSSAENSGPP
jgi:hypothetical protein